MSAREDVYARHQQTRWMQPDAHRWMRPDAVRFLKPGTDIASVFPSLEAKYNPSQPRVPAGSGRESGRWTSGSNGGGGAGVNGGGVSSGDGDVAGSASMSPMGNFDFGDLPNFSDIFSLFQISPGEIDNSDYVQLAGDVPDGDSPELPSNEPPEIPESRPDSTQGRMGFVRAAAEWVARMGRYSPAASAYLGALDQVDELKALTDTIKSANDPPRSLEELQDRVGLSNEGGYHKHHIVEESAARDAGFSEDLIQGRDNLVRIPILKHIDITRYYSTKTEQPDGSRISPRESLKNKTFEERRQFGLMILRGKGVLK